MTKNGTYHEKNNFIPYNHFGFCRCLGTMECHPLLQDTFIKLVVTIHSLPLSLLTRRAFDSVHIIILISRFFALYIHPSFYNYIYFFFYQRFLKFSCCYYLIATCFHTHDDIVVISREKSFDLVLSTISDALLVLSDALL